MAGTRPGSRRGVAALAAAAVAGLAAGTVAVYVMRSGGGNGEATACAGALATAERVEPFATGEVAAFRVADRAERLSDLTFLAPDGGPAGIGDFAGRTVLLNLWATWCVPCRTEMPALDRLQGELGGEDFTVLTVNIDVGNRERALAFLDEVGVRRLAFYADPTLTAFNVLRGRGLALGLPTTILLDVAGCEIGVLQGPAEWDSEDAKRLLRAALAG
jgi:thiol-disulfide isomerase/thioredoxin